MSDKEEMTELLTELNKTLKRQRSNTWISVIVAIALAAAGGYFSALAGVREGLSQVNIQVGKLEVKVENIEKQQTTNTTDIKVLFSKVK